MTHLSAQTDDLLAAVERDLGSQRWHLRFGPSLEARFELDAGRARSRQLVVAGFIALSVYDLFLFNDSLVRPEAMALAATLRLGVMTPYGLAVLWLIRRGVSPRLREALMASTVTVAVTLSSAIFFGSTSPHTIYDPFAFSLIFLAANSVYPLRFVHAVVTSVMNLLIAALFVLAYQPMPAEAKLFALALLAGTAVFTLVANHRLETSERRSYLLLLRETLRSETALQSNRELTVISYTDALTQLANRRRFEEIYDSAWRDAARGGGSIAVLMMDIDNFKRYNDRFGHLEGDRCLRRVAEAIREQVRGADFVARIGGEEFVVVLRNADGAQAARAGERIRMAVEDLAIAHDGHEGQRFVTISIGAGVIQPSRGGTATALLQRSDKALYDAKRGGRNRVHCTTDEARA
ncbi:MAG TPA: diguanylate cyclase [Albitalea sp.]|nr:diguanylate cyclase [Albitalea sp.]